MDLSEYQRSASETSKLRLGGPQAAIAPMLGLASETGSILNVYKKYIRDNIDLSANKEYLREEIGDLLWYAAAVATACDLDLNEIAADNLRRTRDAYRVRTAGNPPEQLPIFDASFPLPERFPRRMVFELTDRPARSSVHRAASMTLVSAEPNAFPDGPVELEGGKLRGYLVGAVFGDPLTDNSRRADAYRFHDAIHIAFMTVLGWSPTLRALLRVKRKSDPEVDEVEDGARAIFAEEGLAAVLSRLAKRHMGFLTEGNIDSETLDVVRAVVSELEVERLPGWLWRQAISQGFQALRNLEENQGGFLIANLDVRTLRYNKVYC